MWAAQDGAAALDVHFTKSHSGRIGQVIPPRAGEAGVPGAAVPAMPPAGPHDCPQSAEHEARGLLNAVVLLRRCLAVVPATEGERSDWLREIREAGERLEQLYAAGLDRGFHIATR